MVRKEAGRSFFAVASRFVWELFNGPIPAGLYVCHKCDVPACVNPDHLFLGTQSDNIQDASQKGRLPRPNPVRGEQQHSAKLTEWMVREIRSRIDMPTIALARAFMVHPSCIVKIRARLTWRHVE
jgi:HNH endonuclease